MDTFLPDQTGAVLVYFCFGAISAAIALLATWGVLWSGPFWIRMLTNSGVVLLFSLWFLGFSLSLGRSEWDGGVVVLLCLPLVLLAIQSPLWLARLVFRWDIVLIRPHTDPRNLRPLTILDMLVGTGLIGIALAGARLAKLTVPGGPSDVEFWIGVCVVVASCIGISLASTLPIVVATLRSRSPVLAMLGIGGYAAFALAVTFVIIGLRAGRTPKLWTMFGISLTAVTFVLCAATPLLVGRCLGLRLRWGRESVGHLDPGELLGNHDASTHPTMSQKKQATE
jgi:hypothetical protein